MPDEGGDPRLDELPAALLERRVLVATGDLDGEQASRLAAALLALDALGDEHVDLRLHACSGSVDAALSLVDVLDVLGVPVHATAFGMLVGGPVAVLAAAGVRRMAAHATLRLRAPDVAVEGSATDVERHVAAHVARREQFLSVLARRCDRPFAELEAEWDRGGVLEAVDAITLGYADEVLGAPVPPVR